MHYGWRQYVYEFLYELFPLSSFKPTIKFTEQTDLEADFRSVG